MTEFSPPPLRAPTACVACNKKKVKECPDRQRERKRQRRQAQGHESGISEERGHKRRQLPGSSYATSSPQPETEQYSVHGNGPSLQCEQMPTPRGESGIYSLSSDSPSNTDISRSSNPYSSASSLSFMARSRYFEDSVVINEDQARSYPIGESDGPTDDDIQILRLQGAFELPPRAVKEGLINTFIEKCSPWMPIIERSWLEESGFQKPSMLLLQSIFVAASRVTSAPAVTAYASTHQFYRRAKALFWSGYEKNPVAVVAAVCILHWYNPEGPEHVSTNTSGFWRYVGVGLAHQIGLHKEPTDRRDAPLRRRLWWTLFARDCLISAGQGRPLAVVIDDCELNPPCQEDFQDSSSSGDLFIAYVEISSILGHLTQYCRRKSLTRQIKKDIENRLYRWTRELPVELRLFQSSFSNTTQWNVSLRNKLSSYSFEARQLHIPYFVCLAIMCRPSPGESPSSAVILASSFIVGIFEDFLARDELQFLGPIFTFHLLAAGIGLLSSNTIPQLWEQASDSLNTIYMSLEVLAKRWSSAKGSLRALKSIAEKQQNARRPEECQHLGLEREYKPFFEGFGPEISWTWPYLFPNTSSSTGPTELVLASGSPDITFDAFAESRPADTSSPHDEYRPLTTILDPSIGNATGSTRRALTDDFFHNQYEGMGDWLFKDLDWSADIPW
ncbi:hypothetical protein N7478_009720 [Penicillium angulare]|uniref:uncharacterized protein n=1 Tax=Penicillium angulare TaxID=116970 RepID=UPI00253FF546|nr:uncharacterized protein N7478_009720 [Penicillium angulare]KAJ5266912.1 hypothetical protein N7478_009720 [Penicillium angulare]